MPLPSPRGDGLAQGCQALLQRMQPGQATPPLPAALKHSLGKAMSQQHKRGTARYTLRRINPTHVRVWRIE